MLSKHHYAIQLGLQGNTVFFLNPPSNTSPGVTIQPTAYQNVSTVDYAPLIRGQNKIHSLFRRLGDALASLDIQRIKRKLNPVIDIVWSFDPYRFQNLKLFHVPLAIFHPVDAFYSTLDLRSAQTADIVLSVSDHILKKYASMKTPTFFINHGVSPIFLTERPIAKRQDDVIRCAYVGNLLSFALHQENLLQIVKENSGVEFHFIGPYQSSNLGQSNKSSIWIDHLSALTNVKMHGELSTTNLAERISLFDLFLVCYDAETFGDVSSNSHKIIEYLSTGKVVVSSYISAYQKMAEGLFEMVTDDRQLPLKFKEVVGNLAWYNAYERQQKRRDFARQNSYEQHLKTIEKLIDRIDRG